MNARQMITAADVHFSGPEHVFRRVAEGRYRLTVVDHGIEFDVDRVWRQRNDLVGELVVSCGIRGARTVDGCLSSGNFNLSSIRDRQDRARHLRERARTKADIDWEALLEELCIRVSASEREGDPARLLTEYERPGVDEAYELDGVAVLKRHPLILFGDGGTAKSYIALYVAGTLAQRGVSVLFADWELTGSDHADRLARLFGAQPPAVHYARCERPLTVEADRLARIVEELGVEYLVCDSVAFAADGPPEAAETAAKYFRAVRHIGIGSLHIAHVTKPREEDKDKAINLKPFGSAFWSNGARSTWFVKRAVTGGDERDIAVGLYHQKTNLGPLRRAVGFGLRFDDETTEVRRIDLADVDELAGSLPLWQRMKSALSSGPRTAAELANEIGLPDDDEHIRKRRVETISRTARRLKNVFIRVGGADGVPRLALVSHRVSS
jgi:hypothetical protein